MRHNLGYNRRYQMVVKSKKNTSYVGVGPLNEKIRIERQWLHGKRRKTIQKLINEAIDRVAQPHQSLNMHR